MNLIQIQRFKTDFMDNVTFWVIQAMKQLWIMNTYIACILQYAFCLYTAACRPILTNLTLPLPNTFQFVFLLQLSYYKLQQLIS